VSVTICNTLTNSGLMCTAVHQVDELMLCRVESEPTDPEINKEQQ